MRSELLISGALFRGEAFRTMILSTSGYEAADPASNRALITLGRQGAGATDWVEHSFNKSLGMQQPSGDPG